MFASVVAPFGGFFASGFKRAFRIKVTYATVSTFFFAFVTGRQTRSIFFRVYVWQKYQVFRIRVQADKYIKSSINLHDLISKEYFLPTIFSSLNFFYKLKQFYSISQD